MASAPSDDVLNRFASGEEEGEGDDYHYDGDDVGEGDSNYHDVEEDMLSISRAATCRLLVHHGWSVSKLRKRKADAGREATYGICFDAPLRSAGMGDAVGYDVFCRCMSSF
ncbi:hypothetical protein Taro_003720 [Colocasia esculenta]|uniref:Uncharacterized protein n=1 Tax=Colocasia esculenta TaxID=4460 RepID=A0A843THZ2_COLES|nr:hypothetical protein [Colocasia esculenta]